ncbi:putative nucleic acid-binding Zn ribbon protein [Sporosarcina luteola]|nr:putative nucleic acid-binding Zn ribbon protein [Sporosarcina luteola]
METCKTCGESINSDTSFCRSCQNKTKRKRSSRLILTFIVILTVIIIEGHIQIKRATAPERTVQRIYEAIVNKNEKALADVLNLDGKLDSHELLLYLSDQQLPLFHDKMKQAAGNVYRNGNPQTVRHEDGQDILTFTRGKKLGLYKEVNVRLLNVRIATDGPPVSKDNRVPIELLVDHAIYSADWQDGDTLFQLYVLAVEDLPELEVGEIADNNMGSYALFLAKDGEKQGVLQPNGIIPFHVEKEAIREYKLGNQHFLGLIDNEESLVLWTMEKGNLRQILFEGQESLPLINGKVKFIEDTYLQTYEPASGKEGWTFTTWVWNPEHMKFTQLHEKSFTADKPYGLETGQHAVKLWDEYDAYYVAFPQFTFTEQSLGLLKDGMLVHEDVQLGMPIDEVLKTHSNFYDHDYYAGGIYYAFPGGRTFFYDELDGNVTYLALSGGALTNELEDLLAILGAPDHEGYDDMNDEYSYFYTFGQNQLRLDREMDGTISSLWLSKHKN